MLFLSPAQIDEILEIISQFHTVFVAGNVGVDILSKQDKLALQNAGVNTAQFTTSKIEEAFRFGILSTALTNDTVKNMDYKAFKAFVKSGKFVPLNAAEKAALDVVKRQAYGDIKGLGNRIVQQVNNTIIQVSKQQEKKMRKQIQQVAHQAIKDRISLQQFSSELGHATKDWSRDFDRIADYIMHSAYQHGRAEYLIDKYGDKVEIYFTVYNGACKHCIETYLTDGLGSEPRIFLLTDVLANGSNIGRKSDQWLPSVDPLHPWCRCTLTQKPANSKWDENLQQFVLVRNTHGVNRKSKIKVTITGV